MRRVGQVESSRHQSLAKQLHVLRNLERAGVISPGFVLDTLQRAEAAGSLTDVEQASDLVQGGDDDKTSQLAQNFRALHRQLWTMVLDSLWNTLCKLTGVQDAGAARAGPGGPGGVGAGIGAGGGVGGARPGPGGVTLLTWSKLVRHVLLLLDPDTFVDIGAAGGSKALDKRVSTMKLFAPMLRSVYDISPGPNEAELAELSVLVQRLVAAADPTSAPRVARGVKSVQKLLLFQTAVAMLPELQAGVAARFAVAVARWVEALLASGVADIGAALQALRPEDAPAPFKAVEADIELALQVLNGTLPAAARGLALSYKFRVSLLEAVVGPALDHRHPAVSTASAKALKKLVSTELERVKAPGDPELAGPHLRYRPAWLHVEAEEAGDAPQHPCLKCPLAHALFEFLLSRRVQECKGKDPMSVINKLVTSAGLLLTGDAQGRLFAVVERTALDIAFLDLVAREPQGMLSGLNPFLSQARAVQQLRAPLDQCVGLAPQCHLCHLMYVTLALCNPGWLWNGWWLQIFAASVRLPGEPTVSAANHGAAALWGLC
jgi:hypothetical protein